MSNRTLALVMAAGKGTRIKKYLSEDEPVKPLVKIGEKRLIDLAIGQLDDLPVLSAVLTYPSAEYNALDDWIRHFYPNARLLYQHATHKDLPPVLEFAYVLLSQYHLSRDRSFLKGFDAIMTLPADLVLSGVKLDEMIDFHYSNMGPCAGRQMTMLSRDIMLDSTQRVDLFKMDGSRIIRMKRSKEKEIEGYAPSAQAGVYIFSRNLLNNPLMLFGRFRFNSVLRYRTEGSWIDYGLPENLNRVR